MDEKGREVRLRMNIEKMKILKNTEEDDSEEEDAAFHIRRGTNQPSKRDNLSRTNYNTRKSDGKRRVALA